MAAPDKTRVKIRLNEEAYDRLNSYRNPGETFSDVIRRLFEKPVDVEEAIRRKEEELGLRDTGQGRKRSRARGKQNSHN